MKPAPGALFVTFATVLVAGAVAAGVWVVGGPGRARLDALDDARLEDLRRLSSAIDAFQRSRYALPPSLLVLAHGDGDLAPDALEDPATRAPYEYQVTSATTYRLCAAFAEPARPEAAIRWRHGRGRTCFDFTAPVDAAKPGT